MNLIQTLKWSFRVFWFYFLQVRIKTKEKKNETLPCLHVQIQTACSSSALSCLFPPLCKTGISKDKPVPRQSAATNGRCSDLSAQIAHPTKARCQADCLYNNNYMHTRKFHKRIINCTLQKLHPLRQRQLGVWVTDSLGNNENASAKCGRRNRKEERKKQAWGMSKPKPFVFFTNF